MVGKVNEALGLISERAPVLFEHMRSDMAGIFISDWNNKFFIGDWNRAYWWEPCRICVLKAETVEKEHVEIVASIIIHESRHARHTARGYGLWGQTDLHDRKRVESLCLLGENSFLAKGPEWEGRDREMTDNLRIVEAPDGYHGWLFNTRNTFFDAKDRLQKIDEGDVRGSVLLKIMQFPYRANSRRAFNSEMGSRGFKKGLTVGARITGTVAWPEIGVGDGSCFSVEMTIHNKTKKPIKIVKCAWYALSWAGEWEEILTPSHLGFGAGELQGLGIVVRGGRKVFPFGAMAIPRYFVKNGAKWIYVDDECNVYASEHLLDLDAEGVTWEGEAWISPSSEAGGLDVSCVPLSSGEMIRMTNARRIAGILSRYYSSGFFRGYRIVVKNSTGMAVKVACFQNNISWTGGDCRLQGERAAAIWPEGLR